MVCCLGFSPEEILVAALWGLGCRIHGLGSKVEGLAPRHATDGCGVGFRV